MQKFEKANFNIQEYNESENYGKFVIEPLERGFGTTLGNSLNMYYYLLFQVLLSIQLKFKEQFMNFLQLMVLLKTLLQSF